MAENFYSSRLLNYAERVDVGGFPKTAFYTEVNTNLKPGDRVFIQNGNYDSDEFIDKDRYAKYVDGYRVISIDRCRIVLDIDFIGLKPFREDHIDNFIKIWNVKSLRDLLYYDSILVDSYNDRRVSKFEWRLSNNLIFSQGTYSVTRPDSSSFSLNQANSFWAKKSNGMWELVSSDVDDNTFSATAGGYFGIGYNLYNNGRLFIYGEDFIYNNKLFKQRTAYKYQDGEWIIDIKYKNPIISKLNFRDGRFKGTHFDGVWGTYQRSLDWNGTFSNWQSGVLVNSNWINGNLNSKSTIASQSYYSKLNQFGLPVQASDFSNNSGHGYNYILDSNIYSGIISDGNFINCNIGSTISSTVSVVNDYFTQTESFKLMAKGGLYNFCDIHDSKIDDVSIFDSRVYNSNLNNSKLLNSQFFDVVANGEFNDESGIKVISADIYSYIPGLVAGLPESDISKVRGVLKLYISDGDLMRLDTFDSFYITKVNKNFILNSLNTDQRVILPFETKYILDRFYNNDFSQQQLTATLKNSGDNKYKPYVTATNSNFYNTFELSGITYSSIDLDIGEILAHYYQGGLNGSLVPSTPTYSVVETTRILNHLNVNSLFTNTVIRNSDFVSGILEDTTWLSGAMINRQSNIILGLTSGRPAISINGDYIDVQLSLTQSYFDSELVVGKNIWIDSIYNSTGQNISGRYLIDAIQVGTASSTITLASQEGLSASSLTSSDFFFDSNTNPNYISVNTVLLKNSTIISGLFKRSLIVNSLFYNESFNNEDQNLAVLNIDQLRIIKTLFKNNSNEIKSGLFYRSHFFSGTWSNGIAYETIWKDAIFNSGIFKSGYWKSGTFKGGKFIESMDTIAATLSFSSPSEYQSWVEGSFEGGEFQGSSWRSGTFSNGKFYNSDWYAGTWQNGILGDINISYTKTTLGNKLIDYLYTGATSTIWLDGVVQNALVGGDGAVYWYGGKFNNGLFTSNGTGPISTTFSQQSIWYNGDFNGGEFSKLSKWKNGNFNDGYFNSYFGWTMSSMTSSEFYSWENGNFNGGKFGNADYATNSTWFDGVFNDGIFQGRLWNLGIFNKGNFIGGATWSPRTHESNFVDSFTNSYYGLWRNGIVIDSKNNIASNEKLFSPSRRVRETFRENVDVLIKNALWLDGTFSSNSAIFDTSAWLGGRFTAGKFKNSIFNPFIKRQPFDLSAPTHSSFNKNSDTVWINGEFESGNFYFSEWKNGTFQNGTMSGAVWRNGTWNYGDANNIYWEDGIWKNGNWDGSNFTPVDFEDSGLSEYQIQILTRIAQIRATNSVHLFNVFTQPISWGQLLNFTELPSGQQLPKFGSEFQTGITYSFLSPINSNDGIKTNTDDYYIISDQPVRLGTTNSNITLFGTQSIDGVVCSVGDRILVKNQTSSINNGIYIASATTWSRALDALPTDLLKTDFGYKTFLIQEGNINSGTYWYNITSTTSSLVFHSSGQRNWSISQSSFIFGTYSYSTPISTIVKKRDVSVRTSDPWWQGESRLLTFFAKGITAAIFTEPVESPGYSINLSYNLIYNTLTGNVPVIKLNIIAGSILDTDPMSLYFNTYIQNIQSKTASVSLGSYSAGTYSVYYIPNLDTINSKTNKIWTQELVENGYDKMLGKILQLSFEPVNSFDGEVTVHVTDVRVEKITPKYDKSLNNKLYNIWATNSVPTYSTTASLPNSNFSAVSNKGQVISMKFGNGFFEKGIWQNGVWNNGWRNDNYIRRCLFTSRYNALYNFNTTSFQVANTVSVLSSTLVGSDFIKINDFTYLISLTSIDDISVYKVGDSISISNIVAIDINENRNLITNISTIVEIVGNRLTLSISVPVTTQRIEQDSNDHIINITKNNWLSGAFLNGRWNGIFNYGLIQGNPYTTLVENTHVIDGIFDGGTMRGATSSFSLTSSNVFVFNSPLVQNFEFYDNNVSVPIKYNIIDNYYIDTYKYNSWIDFNFNTESKTNIYRPSSTFDVLIETDISTMALSGFPTPDILSSVSSFRDPISEEKVKYSLGNKHKVYNSYIPNSNLNIQFQESSTNLLAPMLSGGTLASKLFVNLSKYGWTYSTPYEMGLVITSNFSNLSSGLLTISLSQSSILINNSSIEIESNRYSVIEMEIDSFSGKTTYSTVNNSVYPTLFLFNDPRSEALDPTQHYAFNSEIINHLTTQSPVKKEYFYNRTKLGIYMTSSNFSISFRKVKFNELDMIPFFIYATESQIDQSIKTPYRATAPQVVTGDFNFLDNIKLDLDYFGNYSVPSVVNSFNFPTDSGSAQTASNFRAIF